MGKNIRIKLHVLLKISHDTVLLVLLLCFSYSMKALYYKLALKFHDSVSNYSTVIDGL